MIEKSFNTLISQNSILIEQAKIQIRSAADDELRSRIEKELSDPESIKKAFKAVPIERAEDLNKIGDVRNKLINNCNSLSEGITSKVSEVEGIKGNVDKVEANFIRLSNPDPEKMGIIDTGKEFVPIIAGIIVGLSAGLAFLTGLLGNGKLEKEIGDNIDKAKGKITKFDSIVASFSGIKEHFDKKINSIKEIVIPTLEVLMALKEQVDDTAELVELTYLNTIAPYLDLLVDDDSIPNNATGGNFDILPENYEDLLEKLPTSSKTKITQYVGNSSK